MCRWLAYMGAPTTMEHALYETDYSLIAQSLHARKAKVPINGDGFGVSWYGALPEPGIYRDILPAWSDPNLRNIARQVFTRLFFAHVRASTGTETARNNCHPFVIKNWSFMHNGQIGGYEQLRRRLDYTIPEALYRYRRGTTDSELLFCLFFHFGGEADPLGAWRRLIDMVQEMMLKDGITEPLRITAVLSDGHQLLCLRYASDPLSPTLFWCGTPHEVIVVSEPLEEQSLWHSVPHNHFLCARPEQPVWTEAF